MLIQNFQNKIPIFTEMRCYMMISTRLFSIIGFSIAGNSPSALDIPDKTEETTSQQEKPVNQ